MIALDVRVFRWLHATFSEGGWLALMSVLTVIGGGWGALVLVPLFVSPRTRRFAGVLTGVIVGNALVVFVIKALVQRKRPYLVVPGVHARVFDPPTDFSFPSGHAAGSFAFASFVAVVLMSDAMREPAGRKRRVLLAMLALAAASGVALSRCALGVHFPGDVLLGAVIGATFGALGARWHLRETAKSRVRGSA